MNLRNKTLVITIVTFVCAFTLMAILLSNFVKNGYVREENQLTLDKLEISRSSIEVNLDQLVTFTGDWANWDDTYKFVQDGNQRYIESNLMDETYSENRLNLFAVINFDKGIIYVKLFDLQKKLPLPVEEDLKKHLTGDSPLVSNNTDDLSGLISLSYAPMQISSKPILTSDFQGPVQGRLITGRYLDKFEIQRISNTSHLSITGYKIDDEGMSDDFKQARENLLNGKPTYTKALDENTISGYQLLLDINLRPAMIIKSDTSRNLYTQSKIDILMFNISLFALGILFIILFWFILEKWILSRMAALSSAVSRIGLTGDRASRISLPGKDEVASLADHINTMLDKLDTTKKLQEESESFNFALLHESPNPIEVLNQDKSIRYVNPALERLTGYSQKQLIGRKPPFPWWSNDTMIQNGADLADDMVQGVNKREKHWQKQNGESFWVDITSVSVKQNGKTAYFISNWVDITDRKSMDQALRESEKRFRELAELLPELVFETDLDGTIAFVNKVAFSVFGYLPSEYIGSELLNFVANENKQNVSDYLHKIIENEIVDNIEFTAIRKDDRRFPAFIHATRIKNDLNQSTGLRGIIVDITNQKKIEAQLRASEEYSMSLLRNASYPIIVINMDTTIQYVNPAMESLTGFSSSEIVGMKSPYPWWSKEEIVRYSEDDQFSGNLEIKGQERCYYTKFGEPFWITLTITSIKENGTIKYLIENWVDITERRRAEEALRESEQFNSNLRDYSPYPILVINPDNSIKYVNPAFEKITGFSSAEVLGQTPPYIYWPKDHISQGYEVLNPLDLNHVEVEALFIKKNGDSFWVLINSIPIMDGLNLKYILSTWVDITSQKLASDKLEQLYKREKTLREALQTEIHGRTEFTRALVHELKTPLTPILVSSELLAEELNQEPMAGLAKNIQKGAQNMNRRVDELLDMAKGEVGILKVNLRPVDPEMLLKDVVKYVEPASRSAGQSIVLNLSQKLPLVFADEDRIRQVLLNLINNAIKYSSNKGQITISAREEESNLIFEINDKGRGISEEEQSKLFQPYYRIEGKQHLSGLGLGLVLSKQLIELHGGKIWVKSQKGTGSTFYFSIPLTK